MLGNSKILITIPENMYVTSCYEKSASMLCAETLFLNPVIKQGCQIKDPMSLSLQVRVYWAMCEKYSEDDGSAISVRAVNYDSMIIFSLSSLNYAVCLWGLEECL